MGQRTSNQINTKKEEAEYRPEENNLGVTLAGKWQLITYEPEGCADIKDCSADFMFLKFAKDQRSNKTAVFETFLRLVDENNPGCGKLDSDLTHIGQTFFTDSEFFLKNEEMKFYQGEGTEFLFNKMDKDTLKIHKKDTC